jgi:hypothetical protein
MKRGIYRLLLGVTLVAAVSGVGAAPAWAQPPNDCNGGACSGTSGNVGAEVEHCQETSANSPGVLIATPSETRPTIIKCP